MADRLTQGVTVVEILSDGKALDDSFRLIRVEVEKRVNKISSATIEILDGSAALQDFPLGSQNAVAPGAKLEVKAGFGSKTNLIFKGVVTRVGIRADSDTESRLIVECKDQAVQMTVGRKNTNFVKKKDSEVINTLISAYSNISAKVQATDTVQGELTQYYCSDWDFIVMRAEANGMLVVVDDGEVKVASPELNGKEVRAEYGSTIVSIDLNVDSSSQLASVKTRAWDPKQQKIAEQTAPPKVINKIGNLKAKKLSTVAGLDEYQLQSPVPLEASELKSWGKAQQVKADFSRISGMVRVNGTADAKPGALLKLEGVGARFSGDSYITGVVHCVEDGAWETDIEVGMDQSWFSEQSPVSYPAATGSVASISGLQIGKVLKLDEDPDGEHRIQVSVPVNDANEPGVWARLSGLYASDKCGSFFIPEIDDEVILGFLDGHPSHPIVLGSLYSSNRAPWTELGPDNFIKGFVTRSQMKVQFDEEKKIITIETPEKNTLVFSDEEKSIVMKDQSGNQVTLDEKGITLNSPKDINISADGKVDISAKKNITIDSSGDVSVSGNNVNNEGKMGFKAKGGTTASLEASGQTTVKGAMVMIN